MTSTFDADSRHCPSCKAEIKIEPTDDEIRGLEEDSRLRVLKSFENSIWNQHSRYGILRRTLRHLNTSIENTIDKPGKYLMVEDISNFFIVGKFTEFVGNLMKKKLSDKLRLEDRVSHTDLYLRTKGRDISVFRKWCLDKYSSPQFAVIFFWILLLNIVPIVGEFTVLILEKLHFHSEEKFEKEFVLFEALNVIPMIWYAFDTFFLIAGLGCGQFFHYHGNKIDFIVTIVAVVQFIIDVVVIAAFPTNYDFAIIYVLFAMSCVRLLRLFLSISFHSSFCVVFAFITDEVSSVIYNAYDFGIGFITANEKVAQKATKIIDYEPSADMVQYRAERNVARVNNLSMITLKPITCADTILKVSNND
ncbi:uncharacterized protein CEXT_533961 [Caerostris extrusa]|uniref:Odorant receptor n=1 Tax=Caerostris extrusa TaxID=172846 RepID=A0AAV4P1F6_CAEEX|nr:uncharacterized protein CEXT_533961 [Caerostris extrusa]